MSLASASKRQTLRIAGRDLWMLVILTGITLVFFAPLLIAAGLGLSIAVVIYPGYRWLYRKFQLSGKSHRSQNIVSLGITVAIAIAVLVALSLPVITAATSAPQIRDLFDHIAGALEGNEAIKDLLGTTFTSEEIDEYRKNVETWGEEQAEEIARAIPYFLLKFFVFCTVVYLTLRYGGQIYHRVIFGLEVSAREAAQRFGATGKRTLHAVYVVHFSTVLITFMLAIPLFVWIAPMDGGRWLFWAVLCAVFQLIPFIGPSMIMFGLTAYFGFIDPDINKAIAYFLYGWFVVCIFPDWYLRPRLMAKGSNLHPMIVWVGFFGGIAIMGPAGFVFGPLCLSLLIEAFNVVLERLDQRAREHPGSMPLSEWTTVFRKLPDEPPPLPSAPHAEPESAASANDERAEEPESAAEGDKASSARSDRIKPLSADTLRRHIRDFAAHEPPGAARPNAHRADDSDDDDHNNEDADGASDGASDADAPRNGER